MAGMPARAKSGRTDLVFAALSNPTRRDILDMLLGGERTVSRWPSASIWPVQASRST